MAFVAIVTAAGKGERMGADKALLDLGGKPAIVRVVEQCLDAGAQQVLVVRAQGAKRLAPMPSAVRVVEVDGKGEMKDSLAAACAALPDSADPVVVLPVDHALVAADTVAGVAGLVQTPGVGIVLPLFRDRPGHPLALRRAVFAEILDPGVGSLRDVVRKDPARVRVLPTANRWVIADLDSPADLLAARAALAGGPHSVVEQMHLHRTRRAYAATPLADGQLERLVDAARRASTSSYMQACTVVAVTDPERRAAIAQLCSDQEHIRQAPVFAAVCADVHRIARACAERGDAVQAQSFELFLQATVDAALVGQNLQLAAESEGLGTCMIGAARNHPVALAELLALPPHVYVVFGMTLGHPTDDPVPRGRLPLAGVLHHDRYDQPGVVAAIDGADAIARGWARLVNERGALLRGRPQDERKGWADRMARLWGKDSEYVRLRRELVAELRRLGFGLE